MHLGKKHPHADKRSQQFDRNAHGALDLANEMLRQNPDYAKAAEKETHRFEGKSQAQLAEEARKTRVNEFNKKHPGLNTNNK